jgi:hypothetical protein
MKLGGALIGLGAGAAIFVLGEVDFRHAQEGWEHTTFHPDYEINGAVFLICLGLFIIIASGTAGVVGRLRRWRSNEMAEPSRRSEAGDDVSMSCLLFLRRPHEWIMVYKNV